MISKTKLQTVALIKVAMSIVTAYYLFATWKGLAGAVIWHELCGLMAFIVVSTSIWNLFSFRSPVASMHLLARKWDTHMTAVATVFALFGGFGLIAVLYVCIEERRVASA